MPRRVRNRRRVTGVLGVLILGGGVLLGWSCGAGRGGSVRSARAFSPTRPTTGRPPRRPRGAGSRPIATTPRPAAPGPILVSTGPRPARPGDPDTAGGQAPDGRGLLPPGSGPGAPGAEGARHPRLAAGPGQGCAPRRDPGGARAGLLRAGPAQRGGAGGQAPVTQPGWEARADLMLGRVRAEQSDPAGAAEALRRALTRPDQWHGPMTPIASSNSSRGSCCGPAGRTRPATRSGSSPARPTIPKPAGSSADATSSRGSPPARRSRPGPLVSRGPSPGTRAGAVRRRGAVPEMPQDELPGPAPQPARGTFVRKEQVRSLALPDRPIADPGNPAVSHVFAGAETSSRCKPTSRTGTSDDRQLCLRLRGPRVDPGRPRPGGSAVRVSALALSRPGGLGRDLRPARTHRPARAVSGHAHHRGRRPPLPGVPYHECAMRS